MPDKVKSIMETYEEERKLVADLKDKYDIARVEYLTAFGRARKLDATDDGSIWKVINAQYPAYQILPDTNHVAYVKNNILASIYTVGKSARLIPTTEQDKNIVEDINSALEHIWTSVGVGKYQMEAGERAALLNLGITQVGWNNSIVQGTGDTFKKGEIALKTIDPLKFMRDPFSTSMDTAGYCVTWDLFHKSVLMAHPKYKDKFKQYMQRNGGAYALQTDMPQVITDRTNGEYGTKKDYYTVYTYWVRNEDGTISEYHVVNNECLLYSIAKIKPNCFPFALLYCNLPTPSGKLIGISEPAKIFQSSIAYNIIHSLALTADYKNQRPPRFINGQSGLNVAAFTRTGNDADNTFIVNGDASKAVHYHEFPQVSAMVPSLMANLKSDMQMVTGVDGRYTGRDTGSVITTGGVQDMLDQATMIDAPKVNNYEEYCKDLTKLIIANYINNSAAKRNYMVKDKTTNKVKTVSISFPDIPNDTIFDYEISISSEMPKNKARIQAMATSVMQMQMQYKAQGIDVDLIQPEEWLYMQDLPLRELMLERMGLQRDTSYMDAVSKIIDTYTKHIGAGFDPQEAMARTADMMKASQTPGGEQDVQQMDQELNSMKMQQQQSQANNMLGIYGKSQ